MSETLEEKILQIIAPHGSDQSVRDWGKVKAREILEALREPDPAIVDQIYEHCWKVKMASEDSNIGFMDDAWRAIFDGIMGKPIQ